MSFLDRLFGRKRQKAPQKATSVTGPDYGRSALASEFSDVVKGMQLHCALDERSCLRCLELDGSMDPPPLPLHDGCRCVTLPITKSYEELGITGLQERSQPSDYMRSSAIGIVPRDGGVYKAYLLERAKAIEDGLDGAVLAQRLRVALPKICREHPHEAWEVAAIRARLIELEGGAESDVLDSTIRSLPWDSKDLPKLLRRCAQLCGAASVRSHANAIAARVGDDEYSNPKYFNCYRAKVHRSAGQAIAELSLEEAIPSFLSAIAEDPNDTTSLVELGKAYRRLGEVDNARKFLKRALKIKPSLKGAQREMEKLS